MKNLTLNQAWTLCIEHWDHVKVEIEAGTTFTVYELKEKWTGEHGYKNVDHECFFCEYDKMNNEGDNCTMCPARQIDSSFHCANAEYNWGGNPLAFHAEIHRLYKIFKESEK